MEKKIIVMASGKGTTFEEIYNACTQDRINAKVVSLVTDKINSDAAEKARKMNLQIIIYREKALKEIIQEIKQLKPELIVLAGFLRILPKEFIHEFEGKIMNIHPSLLPCFGGAGMYGINVQKAVIDSGTKITGCTVHLVNHEVDAGPIIAQETVFVTVDDSVESLMEKVHSIELRLYVETISSMLTIDHEITGNKVIFLGNRI
ncbi:Phosphoribosylglycinamide formyltransferase [mine drainage metagenome]|uniref:phosphoribosylglycinamide formyltransferase 1 n=1 Tax=mine drainage metagenome TaxID=410659 RepID=T0YT59_9ZZZZ